MYKFDAFISYRRRDGTLFAKRLRHRLVDYRLPNIFTNEKRKLKIYLDEIYEHATDDFFKNTIQPALKHSRVLIVIQTPLAAERRDDEQENWVAREIRYFSSLPQGQNIWVALAIGSFNDTLPADLQQELPNVERVDIRSLGSFFPSLNEDDLLKFIGPLHGIPHEQMPELRREELKRKRRQRLILGSTIGLVIAIISSLLIFSLWSWRNSQREADRQLALRMASESKNIPAGEYDLAYLLSAEASRRKDVPQASRTLIELSFQNPKLYKYFHCPLGNTANEVAFLENKNLLLLGCGNQVLFFDIKTGDLIREIKISHSGTIFPIPSSDIIVVGGDDSLGIIHLDNTYTRIPAHNSAIERFYYDESEKTLYTRDVNRYTKCWAVEKKRVLLLNDTCDYKFIEKDNLNNLSILHCNEEPVFRYDSPWVLESDLGLIAYASESNNVIVRQLDQCYTLPGNTHNLSSLKSATISSKHFIASAGQIGRDRHGAILWDLNQYNPLANKIWSGDGTSGSIAMSGDGQLITMYLPSEGLYVFDQSGKTITSRRYDSISVSVNTMVISHNNSEVAFLDWQNNINILELTKDSLVTIEANERERHVYSALAYDFDGNVLALTGEGEVWLFSNGTKNLISEVDIQHPNCMHLSDKGDILVKEKNDTLYVKHIRWKQAVTIPILAGNEAPISECIGFSTSSGSVLARASSSYDQNPIVFFDWSKRKMTSSLDNPFTRLSGLTTSIREIYLSGDSKYLFALTSGDESSIIVWNLEHSTIQGHYTISGIQDVAIAKQSNRFITLTHEGLFLWSTDQSELANLAIKLANRSLSLREKSVYDLQE